MPKYRRKPEIVLVDAVPWTGEVTDDLLELFDGRRPATIVDLADVDGPPLLVVDTADGLRSARIGDMVIRLPGMGGLGMWSAWSVRPAHAFNEAFELVSDTPQSGKTHGLDTDSQVFFYEQEFYVLSNFSAFAIMWPIGGYAARFDTSEALYHWHKFQGRPGIQCDIRVAPSAHEAFKIAESNALLRRPDWDAVKVDIMREILRAKVAQHEYVRRKLLETGNRELVENSWRDSFWGWGPNRDGQNMLGKLWMEIRAELRR